MQEGLSGLISDMHQGFVKAWLLEQSVVLMQAMLRLTYDDDTQGIDGSPGILLRTP